MELKIGTVVQSLRGRDEGFFIVVGFDERFAYLADGRSRLLEKPKKKNLRHLRATGMVLEPERVQTNRQLKAALRAAFAEEGNSCPKMM
jgi:ribosomal protein L14E/L6E/L27E